MAELPSIDYNRSIPYQWYLHSAGWLPTRWAYGTGPYGSSVGDSVFGYDTEGEELDYYTVATNNAYCITAYLKSMGWSFEAIMGMCGNIDREGNYNPGRWEKQSELGNLNEHGFGLVQWTPPREYVTPARNIWGTEDPFAPYYFNGWYELYMIASEVFGTPRTQWVPHQAGAGHNPVNLHSRVPAANQPDPPYYNGEYPGERDGVPPPAYDFRMTFEQFAKGTIYDSTAPHSTPHERIEYLTEAFYWDYEQVGDYPMYVNQQTGVWWGQDQTLARRKTQAKAMYDRLLPFFGNFTSTDVKRPTVIGPDFTINDIVQPQSTQSKLIYYLRPWWQRIGR